MISLITCVTTFIIIILAELGDKTQVATLIYSSNFPHKRWQVFLAAGAALVTCVAIEVTLGVLIARLVSPSLINKITGMVFILIGIFSFRGYLKLRLEKPLVKQHQRPSSNPVQLKPKNGPG